MKEKKYTRWCEQCSNYFESDSKISKKCEKCKEMNHEHKRLRNLNLL